MSTQFDASKFTTTQAKPLPVVLMLDTSGSMTHAVDPSNSNSVSKIATLNDAVGKMLRTLSKEELQTNEFLISVITFGGIANEASLVFGPAPASAFNFKNLSADGGTPLGAAIGVAKTLIENRQLIPSRAYRPLVILVSDGLPTDDWVTTFEDFIKNERSGKCDRMALGIGPETKSGEGRQMLERFVDGTNHAVFEAKDAEDIYKFFKFVTMSVVTRSHSQDPNAIPIDATLKPPAKQKTLNDDKLQPSSAGSPAGNINSDKSGSQPAQPDDEDSYW